MATSDNEVKELIYEILYHLTREALRCEIRLRVLPELFGSLKYSIAEATEAGDSLAGEFWNLRRFEGIHYKNPQFHTSRARRAVNRLLSRAQQRVVEEYSIKEDQEWLGYAPKWVVELNDFHENQAVYIVGKPRRRLVEAIASCYTFKTLGRDLLLRASQNGRSLTSDLK